MRKNVVSLITVIALMLAAGSPGTRASAATPQGAQRTWHCLTTPANGGTFEEQDTWEYSGRWVHGTARPVNGANSPNYDYYLGQVGSERIYIEIDPRSGVFFVGVSHDRSLNGSHWNIVFPSEQGSYTFTLSRNQFRIKYADLTQSCDETTPTVAAPPTPTLRCTTYGSDGSPIGADEYLSITRMPGYWWQGVALDQPAGGRVIYEYNIFIIGSERVSVEVNEVTGAYAIATSHSPTLNDSVWTVVYPGVENGFTFKNVSPALGVLPQAFTLVFADGYQQCAPLAGGP